MAKTHAVLVLVLLLAAAGRIVNIDNESLWVDEGFSYWAIQHDDMFGLLLDDVHPPVYFVLLRIWSGFAGITELALRYFSVLPSVLSVAAIYQLGRELERARHVCRESWVPVLAALLLALADMEIYIAQETRMYTWHVLWVILSMWAFLRWIRHQANQRTRLAWMIVSLLLVYTHYIGAAALAVQFLYALIFLRDKTRIRALVSLMIVGALFVPWLLLVVGDQTANVGTGFNVPSTLESLWNWRENWLTAQWPLHLLLALLGLLVFYRNRILIQPGIVFLLLGWIVIPVAGAYVLNFTTPILMDYRLTQITPAVVLLVASGMGNLRGFERGLIVAAIVIYGVTTDDTAVQRPPWREVGANAAKYAQPGDLALAHVTPSGDWQVIYYYDRFMPDGVERYSLRQWQREQSNTYWTGVPALLADHDHVWLMHWSQDRSAFDMLRDSGHVQTAVMTEDWLGNDLNVYRYDRLPPEPLVTYAPGITLRDAQIYDMSVDLWWSAPETPDNNYIVSVFLLDNQGQIVAQHDAQPWHYRRPTSSWSPGEVVYDPHMLAPVEGSDSVPAGTYRVGVKLYLRTDDGFDDQLTDDGQSFAIIGTIVVD